MKKTLLLLCCCLNVGWITTHVQANDSEDKSRDKSIYIMPEDLGWSIVEQCTRTVYYPDVFWRVTEDQVTAIEKRLIREIEKRKQNNEEFVPTELKNYKRQYIGFEMNEQSYIYANFFPRTYPIEVDPVREGVALCRSHKGFWGMLFNIDTFAFEAIERNDKMVKPKGAWDPGMIDLSEPEPSK